MQDRIQLKREEVVGEGVALSDINPVTNTKSVDDDAAGVPLEVTIERLWQAINNSLSRVVNSVNGRSGIIVITADDVGLGNVTNVSYGTIQEWVIKELADQFGVKRLMLFDTEAEMNAAMEGWRRDTGHANVPFYIRNNSTKDMRSFIGYFAWDDATAMLVPVKKAIDTIGYADNSIIYNESINGRALGNGGIGVNIWSGEDALKIYNASAVKSQGGLMIDKDKIAPHVYFYNGAYGNDASEGDLAALVYTDDGVTTVTKHKLRINVKGITITDPTVDTCQTFKKNDIIVCNFSDNGYRNNDGSLKSNVVPELVCRESMIGAVISVPDGVDPSSPYVIDFFPIKPYVGMGLKYYEVHTDATTNKKSTMIGIDLLTGKMTSAFIDANVSGINAFSSPDRYDVTISDMKTNHTVTPVGRFSTSVSGSNSAFISPDFSMNIVPSNIFGNTTNSPITNWPTKTPGESTNGNSRPIGNQSFVGVNLLKKVDTTNKTAYNMSGLRIIDPFNSNDTITNNAIGKSDNDTTDKFATDAGTTSGGLMVNVGKFLEIGTNVGDDATRYDGLNGNPQYYAGGKVNVRVNEVFFKDDDNRLDLNISNYKRYAQKDPNTVLGGGLVYTEGYNPDSDIDPIQITAGLTINRGMGLRMSHYDRTGNIPADYIYTEITTEPDPFDPTEYYVYENDNYRQGNAGETYASHTWYSRSDNNIEDRGFLTVSVIDSQYTSEDMGQTTDNRSRSYGGLRYFIGDEGINHISSIGIRVNSSTDTSGHQLRLGEKAIGIDENNIVQVQRYRESDDPNKDTNPLVIKGWNEEAIYPYVKNGKFSKTVTVDSQVNLPGKQGDPYSSPDSSTIYFIKDENKHYVWSGNGSGAGDDDYVTMFTTYNGLENGVWNRVYVETIVDNIAHTFVGNAYQWNPGYTVRIPGSWVPDQSPEGGSYRTDGPAINATIAGNIVTYYAAIATLHNDRMGYYNTNDGRMYSDIAHTAPMANLSDGAIYGDITNEKPYILYKYDLTNDVFVPLIKHEVYEPIGAVSYTQQDLLACDVDNDGQINATDASICLAFYAYTSTGAHDPVIPEYEAATTLRDKFEAWLKYYGYAKDEAQGYELIHGTDPNGSFMPGLDINLNEHQGVTSNPYGDLKDTVSLKIFDKTAGVPNCATEYGEDPERTMGGPIDPTLLGMCQGGLRFNKDGYLGVRVNAMNTYNASTPNGRKAGDYCRTRAYRGGSAMSDQGTRGLRIYGNNVLGIQLDEDGSLDNGQLAFDEYGSLIISPQYHGGGGGELLTITDGTTTVEYNGSVAQTITLGPGLKLEPDPTPNP